MASAAGEHIFLPDAKQALMEREYDYTNAMERGTVYLECSTATLSPPNRSIMKTSSVIKSINHFFHVQVTFFSQPESPNGLVIASSDHLNITASS